PQLTPALDARTAPGLLDLGVALAAGAAGAYVAARRTGADALPGVAIAVSLVPPLATVRPLPAPRSDGRRRRRHEPVPHELHRHRRGRVDRVPAHRGRAESRAAPGTAPTAARLCAGHSP